MRIKKAFESGLVRVGLRVITNGDRLRKAKSMFTGIVTYVGKTSFTIHRDDGVPGCGYMDGWDISSRNSAALISIGSAKEIIVRCANCKKYAAFFTQRSCPACKESVRARESPRTERIALEANLRGAA